MDDFDTQVQCEEVYEGYTRAEKPNTPPKEGHIWVYNFMSDRWVQQREDTPWVCRVDSEAYWSM